MLRVQVMSDIHTERGDGVEFVNSLNPELCDVLSVAGDFGSGGSLIPDLRRLCQKYAPRPVLFTIGNHECWCLHGANVTKESLEKNLRELEKECSNFHFLNREVFEYRGQRFLGTTLWYTSGYRTDWSDFKIIKDLVRWIDKEAKLCADWLRQEARDGDFVITHMLPSSLCIAEKWQGTDTNCFFINDITDVLTDRELTWHFGHTHEHLDLQIGKTRARSNPRGYPFDAGHALFDPALILEIGAPLA